MELNRDQVVKALECCGRIGEHPHNCGGCPLPNALNYRDRVYCRAFLARYALALIRELAEEVAKAKADTVRKFAERLKEEAIDIQDHMGEFDVVVLEEDIDRIAEELLEEGK